MPEPIQNPFGTITMVHVKTEGMSNPLSHKSDVAAEFILQFN